METQDGLISAPYGRACEACSRAKCRCLFKLDDSTTCERCHRLKKVCRPGELKRPRSDAAVKARKASRSSTTPHKTVELERKIDQLVQCLQQGTNASLKLPTPGNTSPDTTTTIQNIPVQGYVVADASSSTRPRHADTMTDSSFDIFAASKLSQQEAEECLRIFKEDYLFWAPYVHLPASITAQSLYAERPMFWLSIMLTCRTKITDIRYLDCIMRGRLAAEMVVKSRKSIDLLLAVITYLYWYYHHCRLEDGTLRLSLSLITHLAISLVSNLKRPGTAHPQHFLSSQLESSREGGETSAHEHVRTMEESRAFLACFLITASKCSALQRVDSLRWDKYLEQCLVMLEQKAEWDGDRILATQVRMQLIVEKVTAFKQWEAAWEFNSPSCTSNSLLISTMQADLQRLKLMIESHLQENHTLKLHALYIELAIFELGLLKPRGDAPLSIQQVMLRSSCLKTAKAWVDAFLATDSASTNAHAMTIPLQMSKSMAILFYLSTTSEPGWDVKECENFNPLELVDRVIAHMDEGARVLGPDEDDTVATQAQLNSHMRNVWAVKLVEKEQRDNPNTLLPTIDGAETSALDDSALRELFDAGLWDYDWMSGLPSAI